MTAPPSVPSSAADPRSTMPPIEIPLPGDFVGPTYRGCSERFTYELEGAARRELARLVAALDDGEALDRLQPTIHAVMAEASARTQGALRDGPGFCLIRGVPVEGRSRVAVAALYTAIGHAIGRPTAQNFDGELITDVRDTGESPLDPDVRLYRTRAEQDFHTDGADVIGLLCLQTARAGGASRIVSSVRVFQVVRALRPDLAPLLFEPWFFQLPGARARGLPEALPRPITTFDGRKLETFFIGWYLRNAQQLASVPPFDDARRELLALYEATANDPALSLDMEFRPGDIQWLRNAFILHKRTAYEDHPEPERKRHLLRLWLASPQLDDRTPRFARDGGLPR